MNVTELELRAPLKYNKNKGCEIYTVLILLLHHTGTIISCLIRMSVTFDLTLVSCIVLEY
jgi:hypothetical protein